MTNRVETKVIAAAGGAGGGGVFGTLILWVLGASLFGAGWGADQVEAALAAVPSPIVNILPPLLAAAGALAAGFSAPHTPRTPLEIAAEIPAYDPRHDDPTVQ